ncbi:MAG: ABC transporter ATP-binding protein [Chloroflexi bacterium]|nr:ABC transporter ATP-binding protein [Chloroflexota bacterium]
MLEVAGLTVRYGVVTAVAELDLRVERGEIVVVLGPNGAGKSTLLRTIAGVHRPAAGSVRFDGSALPSGVPENVARRGISLVPEGRRIFGELTVEENLRLGATPRPRDSEAANLEALYGRFAVLAERRRQVAGTLSGGEQQQLAIARALMAEPRLILYDEPSLGLAPRIVDQIFELIAELRDEGVTSLLVEQNAHRALGLADRAYVLSSGRVIAQGSATELDTTDLTRLYFGDVGAA